MNVFDPSYWLTLNPPDATSLFGRVVFILFVLMFLAGIGVRSVGRKQAKDRHDLLLVRRTATLLTTMGLLGVFLYFFSIEGLRMLGGRIWYLVWLVIVLVWAGFILRFLKRDIPERRQREQERLEKEKYLPKPNKK